jgi:uncharacterized protein YggE
VTEQPYIAVIGTGVANGLPDQCRVHISLNHMAESAADALAGTAELATNVIAGLAEVDVDHCDVQTVGLSVQDYMDPALQKVTARFGTYQLELVVRPIDGTGKVLAALASTAGDGLQVRGLQLTIKDPEPLKSEARRLAVRDAMRKADELANEAGVRLGALLSIQDENAGSGIPPSVRRAIPTAAGFSAVNLPIEVGDVSLMSAVMVTFALEGEARSAP